MRGGDKCVYLQKRGTAVYDHRRAALGYLSGSLRYAVLKRAGFRCELCGISADERAIEVDHIIPRKHGGEDDLTNLQALCFKCNANKGARDDVDFRVIREGMNARQSDCIFCNLSADRIIASNALAFAIRDNYPVTQLHTMGGSRTRTAFCPAGAIARRLTSRPSSVDEPAPRERTIDRQRPRPAQPRRIRAPVPPPASRQ